MIWKSVKRQDNFSMMIALFPKDTVVRVGNFVANSEKVN